LHHPRFRCHSSHLTWTWCPSPRHVWPWCPSPCHARPRCPRRPLPRHMRLRHLHPRHARPRHHLHAMLNPCRCTNAVQCLHRRYLFQLLHQRCP
jgi:hypothetical protein